MKLKIIRAATMPQSLNNFCLDMLKELSMKYDVMALSSPGDVLNEIEKREGVRTIGVPMKRRISILNDIKSLIILVKVFRDERPTMVHSMTPKAGLLCMLAAWLTRIPVRVHTFTGLVFPTSTGLKRSILMATDRLTCACATHIIPEGNGVKNDLLMNSITKKPLKVLGYGNVRGVDMQHYSRRPEVMRMAESLRNESVFTYLFVGRIVKDKGINELCEAYARIHDLYPFTRCWIVGNYEDDLDPISSTSKTLIEEYDNGLISVGRKMGDELLAYYASADCFVMPSYREGFPNTVLEAGAMGLPSIVTDINGSREIIINGENGLIVPPHNVNALFDAMLKLLKDETAREKMADNAREMIASRYEQSYVRKCLYEFYDEILTSNV